MNLASRKFCENKFRYYRWMQDEAPVCHARLSLLRMFRVAGHQDRAHALRAPRHSQPHARLDAAEPLWHRHEALPVVLRPEG